MYMTAYVKMGASKAKLGSSRPANVAIGADWGGPEAIGKLRSSEYLLFCWLLRVATNVHLHQDGAHRLIILARFKDLLFDSTAKK